jgi:hypothetical protein
MPTFLNQQCQYRQLQKNTCYTEIGQQNPFVIGSTVLSHRILWLGNFIGVGCSLFLAATEVPSLDRPAVRLNPNLPPFGDVCLDRNTIARRTSPRKLRLARVKLGGFWLAQWRNTKVGCLVILRKLMCYSLSATKDQEVCTLCVAEKFFTYWNPPRVRETGALQNESANCSLRPTAAQEQRQVSKYNTS